MGEDIYLEPGWLYKQVQLTKETFKTYPKWLQELAEQERKNFERVM